MLPLNRLCCISTSAWQPELVKVIQSHLRVGGTLFMQSDILDMLEDMRLMVREEGGEGSPTVPADCEIAK